MLKLLVLYSLFHGDVEALRSDDFAKREAAEARLSRHATWCYPLLEGRTFADPEQRRRARRVLEGVTPREYPPLTLLLGEKTLLEWQHTTRTDEGTWLTSYVVGSHRPQGDGWRLAYLRCAPHDEDQAPAAVRLFFHVYHERVRTDRLWRDWHNADDARDATRALYQDLRTLGLPPVLLRALLLDPLLRREEERSRPQLPVEWGQERR